MSASQVLLYLCLSFILGIFINSLIFISLIVILGFLIAGLIIITIFYRDKRIIIAGFCLLFLVAGVWRHQMAEAQVANSQLRTLNNKGEITLIGIVIKEPEIKEKSIKLTVNVQQLTVNKENIIKVDEKALITISRYPEYRYGDKLKIIGKLETPEIFEGFNYKDYLKKDGIYSVMYFPEIDLLEEGKGNFLMGSLISFKDKFQRAVQTFISPPQEGILEALIFGEEENIPKEWKDKLNVTGTRHITAVSGMNTTIVGFLILSFALGIGLWRQQAFYFSLFILFLYILMVGAPASAVRAGIMAAILMIAQYFGRLSSATRAVVFSATLMLIFNPLLLRLDVGFQLSFLAILGLVYLQPSFFEFFKKVPNPKFFPIRTTLSATLAAQTFTLPILIYNFGRISLLSPISNILIVPFLAPFTILLFIFGLGTIILRPLGFLLFFPSWLSLVYITLIVDSSSKISFASLSVENIHWIWLFISYIILGYIVWRINERQKLKFLNY